MSYPTMIYIADAGTPEPADLKAARADGSGWFLYGAVISEGVRLEGNTVVVDAERIRAAIDLPEWPVAVYLTEATLVGSTSAERGRPSVSLDDSVGKSRYVSAAMIEHREGLV